MRGSSGDRELAERGWPLSSLRSGQEGKVRQAGCLTGGPGQRPELRAEGRALAKALHWMVLI